MIEIIPAIDIINGQCVRLSQGNYTQKTVYSDDPVLVAKTFENNGFKRLHLVDLDGAKSGEPKNLNVLKKISTETNLTIDYSGGLRTVDQIQKAFENGASYIGIGSMAIKNQSVVRQLIKTYGAEKFILAADVMDFEVYINGWLQSTGINIFDLISNYNALGVNQFMCTDISRDGMLAGINVPFYNSLRQTFPESYIVASGGISSIEDIYLLEKACIDAVIVGKAFYEGRIKIEKINFKQC